MPAIGAQNRACFTGPLSGIRIVEFDAIGPVPLAGMLFADMGADVVRITRPQTGNEAWSDVGGAILHRGRTAVELDLKDRGGREQALRLIAQADASVEGLRPGVMERLGIGPERCFAVNPRLVYGRMTGWGQSGPLSLRAGHDINYLALTGALHAIGSASDPPPVPLNLLGDYGGGAMFLIAGVLAALLSARVNGCGQVVDASIVEGVAAMTSLFHAFRASGQWNDTRQENLLDGAAPFYRCYACADGRFIAVGALEPQFYRQLLTGLGLEPESYPQHERARWQEMTSQFARIFAGRSRHEWAAIFANTDACVTPVLTWAEVTKHPHHQARGTYVVGDGEITQPAPAPRFSRTVSTITRAETSCVADILARWTQQRGATPER